MLHPGDAVNIESNAIPSSLPLFFSYLQHAYLSNLLRWSFSFLLHGYRGQESPKRLSHNAVKEKVCTRELLMYRINDG